MFEEIVKVIDLSGNWTNKNRTDRDDVVILHRGNELFVHGTDMNSTWYRNFGFAKMEKSIDELNSNDVFTMTWTDTFDSKGSEKGIVHKCKIKIKDENTLEQVEDKVIKPNQVLGKHQTTFGNWIRKQGSVG